MANDGKLLICKDILYAGDGDIPTFEHGSKVNQGVPAKYPATPNHFIDMCRHDF